MSQPSEESEDKREISYYTVTINESIISIPKINEVEEVNSLLDFIQFELVKMKFLRWNLDGHFTVF